MSPPLYRLAEEESGRELVTAHDIDGFFVDDGELVSREVTMLGVGVTFDEGIRTLTDVNIEVLRWDGIVLGTYFSGWVKLNGFKPGSGATGSRDLMTTFGYVSPYVGAGSIWRHWASGSPLRSGEWVDLPIELRPSWLHVAQNAWFRSGRQARRYGTGNEWVVDGGSITSVESFYCSLGEAVNGPRGYFGANLDGLEDCLRSSGLEYSAVQITWRDFRQTAELVDPNELAGILAVLRDHGVGVNLR
jgi:RNAse (barnase) inhibitor barstar